MESFTPHPHWRKNSGLMWISNRKACMTQPAEPEIYYLSVNIYLPEIIEREEINPSVLENEARRSFLERLRKELDFDKMVCEMEGISIQPFINAIRKILKEYEARTVKKKDENQMSLFDLHTG